MLKYSSRAGGVAAESKIRQADWRKGNHVGQVLDNDDRILGVNYALDPPAYLLYISPPSLDMLELHCWYSRNQSRRVT